MRGRGLRGCCPTSSPSGKPANIIPIIAAGTFRQRVTIQRPVLARGDGQGGFYEQWADLATVWARIETTSDSHGRNREKFQDKQLRYQEHFNVCLRYGNVVPIETSFRLLYTGPSAITQILQIVSVENVSVVNWEVTLYCREGGNIG